MRGGVYVTEIAAQKDWNDVGGVGWGVGLRQLKMGTEVEWRKALGWWGEGAPHSRDY